VSVTLFNDSPLTARGELVFDAQRLQPASDRPAPDGRLAFELGPRGEKVVVLRVLPAARGEVVSVAVNALSAKRADGAPTSLSHDAEQNIEVDAE
jgi:general secretion pathway protein D